MKGIHIMLLGIAFFLSEPTQAQLSKGGEPYSFDNFLPSLRANQVKELPYVNMDRIRQYAPDNQFGYSYDVDVDMLNSGEWTTLDNGDQVWRLVIRSQGARSLHLQYQDFWLPDGAEFFVYTPDRSQVIGAFTSKNNKGLRDQETGFATALMMADEIVLEYYEPRAVAGEGQIRISKVIHGYTDFSAKLRAYGDSESCQNNVNCSIGNDWQNEKRGVAYIVMGGFICTGALLNTFAQELVPYFLSANHCSDLDAVFDNDASDWLFYWDYETPGCSNPTRDPILDADVTTGAILLADLLESDFALFRLLEDPINLGLWYLGWDAGNAAPTEGVGIHHPSGDAKKISIENDGITNFGSNINWDDDGDGNTDYTTPPNTHWRVLFDDGGTEGGSSGSPLFDQNKRVVGQLHGGTGDCPGDDGFRKFYGRFDVSWTGNGSSSRFRRLSDWLGQGCSTFLTVTTSFFGDEPVRRAFGINARNFISSNAFVRYEGTSYVDLEPGFDAVAGSDFSASIGAGCSSSREEKQRGTTAAIVEEAFAYTTHPDGRQIVRHVVPNRSETPQIDVRKRETDFIRLAPNPAVTQSTLQWKMSEGAMVRIQLKNAYGQHLKELLPAQWREAGYYDLDIDATGLSSGLYYLVINQGESSTTKSLMIVQQ